METCMVVRNYIGIEACVNILIYASKIVHGDSWKKILIDKVNIVS